MFSSQMVRPLRGNATLTVQLGLRPQRIDLTEVSASGHIPRERVRNSERFTRAEDWELEPLKVIDGLAVTLH